MMHPGLRIAIYGVLFFSVTSLTIFSTRFAGGLALVWPGTALATALFLTLPTERHVHAGAVLVALSTSATALFGFGPDWSFPLGLVNIFEGWFVAFLLNRARPQRDFVESESGVVWLGFLAGIVGIIPSAVVGGAIAAQIVGGNVFEHAASWLVGHGLGTLLVLPLALLLESYSRADYRHVRDWRRVLPFIAILSFTALVSVVAFSQSLLPALFLPIVPLVLASFRFRRFGAAIAVLIITAAAAGTLASETGTFAELAIPLWQKALFLQFYVVILLLIAFPMAVAIQQRQRVMDELVDREAMQRLIADHSDDALLQLDGAGTIRFASPASRRLSGRDDVEGLHVAAFFSAFDRDMVAASLEKAAEQPGQTKILERSVEHDGETRWLEAKLRAIKTSRSKASGFVVTIRDVTERKLDELQASREARTDPLTGLPNRRAFLDMLDRKLRTAEQAPFAFALVDLDHFKRVNDSYGHTVGDAVLTQIGRIMHDMASEDCFFARLGGEEFGIIATGPVAEIAPTICERLRLAIQQKPMSDNDGGSFHITASIGVAAIGERCSSSMAMQAADGPLYMAKASGRNCTRRAQDMGALASLGTQVRKPQVKIAG